MQKKILEISTLLKATPLFFAACGAYPYAANAVDMPIYHAHNKSNYSPHYQDTGLCTQKNVLNRVNRQFHYGIRHIPNMPQIRIVDMTHVHMTNYKPALPYSNINRTFCSATAVMSDNSRHQAWYMIEKVTDFIGTGMNVQGCIQGLDPWRINGARCKAVRLENYKL